MEEIHHMFQSNMVKSAGVVRSRQLIPYSMYVWVQVGLLKTFN